MMRPSGAAVRQPEAGLLLSWPWIALVTRFSVHRLLLLNGPDQMIYTDAPMTLPVYTLLSIAAYMTGQSSVQTVLACPIGGVSST